MAVGRAALTSRFRAANPAFSPLIQRLELAGAWGERGRRDEAWSWGCGLNQNKTTDKSLHIFLTQEGMFSLEAAVLPEELRLWCCST